jgi:poly(3-hydroxybutyrate) depolymerase
MKSIGCGLEPVASDTSIQVNGMRGTYIIDLPEPYDKNRAYPLVLSFRGAGVVAEQFRGYLDLPTEVGAEGIVVNVNCLGDANAWDVQRDLPLFDELLTHLEESYCLDPHRVFAAGHTSGGYFVSSLGCSRANKLRAIAPLSAVSPVATCEGQLAVWISQGNVGTTLGPGRANRDFWIQRNHCDASLSTPVDPSPRCVSYAGCDAGFPVHYCEYDGDIDLPSFAAKGVWAFFRALK